MFTLLLSLIVIALIVVFVFQPKTRSAWISMALIVGTYCLTLVFVSMSSYVMFIWIGYIIAYTSLRYLYPQLFVTPNHCPPASKSPPRVGQRSSRVIAIEEVED